MGKVDDMRAMREARFTAGEKTSKSPSVPSVPSLDAQLCGHRAISGKTCTRPKDHSEKNHRYT